MHVCSKVSSANQKYIGSKLVRTLILVSIVIDTLTLWAYGPQAVGYNYIYMCYRAQNLVFELLHNNNN